MIAACKNVNSAAVILHSLFSIFPPPDFTPGGLSSAGKWKIENGECAPA
jgi:hypothetical protein